MLYYQALFLKDIEDYPDQQATGLIIAGSGRLEYIIWDHRARTWRYDPEAAGYILGSWRHEDRRRSVTRQEAEEIAMRLSEGTDPLPSEEELLEAFRESHRRREQGTLP